MKKMFVILLLAGLVYGQDVTTTMGNTTASFRDTLTATIDTVRVNMVGSQLVTITAYTTTGTDTIDVYSTPKGYVVWAQKGLKDLTADTVVSRIIITTTPKEFTVLDPEVVSLLLIAPDVSANCVFIVSKKKGNL